MLAWIGTLTSILGSFTVALGFMLPGYSLFTVGAESWLTVGARRKDWSLVVLNATFFAANLIGLYRAIF